MYVYIFTIYILSPEGEDKFAPVPKCYVMNRARIYDMSSFFLYVVNVTFKY
jgi:hypothetical protein